jgi:hypothetical protein
MFAPAYVARGGQPSRRFCYAINKQLKQEPRANGLKAFQNIIFNPCTLMRTWGTRPRTIAIVGTMDHVETTDRRGDHGPSSVAA